MCIERLLYLGPGLRMGQSRQGKQLSSTGRPNLEAEQGVVDSSYPHCAKQLWRGNCSKLE